MKPHGTAALVACLAAILTFGWRVGADPLAPTYSIIARDAATGDMGVAVQSHWFSVGSIVTVTLASLGREADARPIFKQVFAKEPVWADLLTRLPSAGLFPNDQALIARIRALAARRDKE